MGLDTAGMRGGSYSGRGVAGEGSRSYGRQFNAVSSDWAGLDTILSGIDFSGLDGLNLGNVGAGLESSGWGDSYSPGETGTVGQPTNVSGWEDTSVSYGDSLSPLKQTMKDLASGNFGGAIFSGAESVYSLAKTALQNGDIDAPTYNNIVSSTADFASGKIDGSTYQGKALGNIGTVAPIAPISTTPTTEGQFWDDFIDKFYGVGTPGNSNYKPSYNDLLAQDDTFKKEAINNYITKLQAEGDKRITGSTAATGKYTNALGGINQDIASGKGNISFGMKGAGSGGQDFAMDFTPKSLRYNRMDMGENAKNILGADLSLADLIYGTNNQAASQGLSFADQLSPAKTGIDYTNKLQELGQYVQDLENKLAVARTAPEQNRSTDWLKAIGDVIKVGDSGYSFYDRLFGKKEETS